jgi:hypothetical protein
MDVVKIDEHALGRIPAHKGESLGSQAIRAGSIRALIPLDACEINPVRVRDGVETTSDCCAS